MVLSSNGNAFKTIQETFNNTLNYAHIFEENREVTLRVYHRSKESADIQIFESSQCGNLSESLFPDKSKNLHKLPLYVAGNRGMSFDTFFDDGVGYNKWMYFIKIVAKKMNATIEFTEIAYDMKNFFVELERLSIINELIKDGRLDFYLNGKLFDGSIESYNYIDYCFLVPLPTKYSIYELILLMPLDTSCWMWLSITVVATALVWRLSDGKGSHWNYLFGVFAYFVGQSVEIRT